MTNRQERKKARKQKKGLRIVVAILVVTVLVIGGGGTIFLMDRLNTEAPIQTPQQVEVTLSEKLTETQADVKQQRLVGDSQELEVLTTDAIAQIFTYMPLTPETDFHGTSYIIPERRQDYLEFLKTTLYFYYKDLVSAYGETGLPTVANVEITDTLETEFVDEIAQETKVAYEVTASWDYTTSPATTDVNQQWSNTATLTWTYDESQSKWFLVDLTTDYDESLPFVDAFTGNSLETTTTETETETE